MMQNGQDFILYINRGDDLKKIATITAPEKTKFNVERKDHNIIQVTGSSGFGTTWTTITEQGQGQGQFTQWDYWETARTLIIYICGAVVCFAIGALWVL